MKKNIKIIKTGNFINKKWCVDGNGSTLEVYDKYNQSLIATVPYASAGQVEDAIAGSVRGFAEFKMWSAGKKAEYLKKLIELLRQHMMEFVDLIVAESGKPFDYAKAELERCLTTLSTAATEAVRFSGEMVPIDFGAGTGKTAYTRRFPVGPVLCITPFNFPLNLALHKIGPALAVGCSVVLKPPPQAPLTALAFADLVDACGYPAGVVNVLVCDIPEAEMMVKDNRIKMISFTGSENVGWHLKNICGRKKVALELGGNAAVIVDESAELETAAKSIANGSYLYAGQICISTQRILVHHSVYDRFMTLLLDHIKKIKMGDPTQPGVIVGPVIDRANLDRIQEWIDEAEEQGARVLIGGKVASEKNNLYQPTLLTDTSNEMKIVSNEVFGPVATIEKFGSFDEGVRKANDSAYGLQAGVFTKNIDHIKDAHQNLDVGAVIINNVPGFRIDNMPYGGVKASGFGREGIRYVMEEMTEPRLIVY